MSGYLQETNCPVCGTSIFDLNLSDDEGILCCNCYRQQISRKKEEAVREG